MPTHEIATKSAFGTRFDPFGPAIALMRRMRIRVKFFLIALLFIVPLLISAAVFLHRLGADLGRTERQLSGLRYSRALLSVSELLQDRRAATDAALRGDADARVQLVEVDSSLDAAVQRMQGVNALEGVDLGLSPAWEKLLAEWQSVRSLSADVSSQRSYEAHTTLLENSRVLLQATLDGSQLALDQDIAVHHAVRAGFQQAQSLVEWLAATRTLAVSALQRKVVSDAERALLRAAAERVRIYHADLNAILESLFESTPALRGALSEVLEGASQAERFTNVVEKAVLNTTSITMPAAPVASLGMKATKSAQQISIEVVAHVERALSDRHRGLERTRLVVTVASSLLVFSACYLLIAFIRAVRLDLGQVAHRLDDIASGVLTGQSVIRGRDEFSELLERVDSAQENLLALIRDVQSGAKHMDSATRRIVYENTELSERTGRMMGSLEQASRSVLELARSVNEGRSRADTLDPMARQSSRIAADAGRMVEQVVQRIQAISASSKKIEEIVATVDAITFQTRLLSLNAAVEAARAGEQGRGFGVVATEVRQLAARSQQASSEIRTLVQASLNEVSAGTRIASDAHTQMLGVVDAARKLSEVIGEVTRVAQAQGEAAVNIAPLLQQVKADSGHNAERVSQVAVAANELDVMARGLHTSIARFRIDADASTNELNEEPVEALVELLSPPSVPSPAIAAVSSF